MAFIFNSNSVMKIKNLFCAVSAVALIVMVGSCGSGGPKNQGNSDSVKIAVDETFRLIMDEEMKQFNLNHPEATLDVTYCNESRALQMFLDDSVRLCLATRRLTDKEKEVLLAKQLNVMTARVATDAIALIVNRSWPDSLISAQDVMRIVSGKITKWDQLSYAQSKGDIDIVFDNPQSSTVRYVEDSILGGKAMSGNVHAQKTNEAVIEYVTKTPGAIGVVGVDWLRNEKDTTNLSFRPDVRVMSVSRSSVPDRGNSYKPFQAYIATGDYPFVRAVFVMTSDPAMQSMTRYFYHFLRDQKGQLIITKSSQLLPYMQVQFKEVTIN